MTRLRLATCVVLATSWVLCPRLAPAQDSTSHPTAHNLSQTKFVGFPGMPMCAPGAVMTGDPAAGPSIIVARMAAGCTFPWHWHTPNEHLIMVSGVAVMQTKDGEPMTLRSGGFMLMPSHHVHQFRARTACTLYVYSDAALDMHYVDAQGNEITPEAALKAVGETPAPAK
jgi:quercetin dioxygenase-like cupin family protein